MSKSRDHRDPPGGDPTTQPGTTPSTGTSTTTTPTTAECATVTHTALDGTVTDVTAAWAAGTAISRALFDDVEGTYEICPGTWFVGLRAWGPLEVIGVGQQPVILDAAGEGPVIHMGSNGASVVVDNVTLYRGGDGWAEDIFGGPDFPAGGGGIFCEHSQAITVRNTVFDSHHGAFASAIYANECGDIDIQDSAFRDNTGGGLVWANRPLSFHAARLDVLQNEGVLFDVSPNNGDTAEFEDIWIDGGRRGFTLWGEAASIARADIGGLEEFAVDTHYNALTLVDSTVHDNGGGVVWTEAVDVTIERTVIRDNIGAPYYSLIGGEASGGVRLNDVDLLFNDTVGRASMLVFGEWELDSVHFEGNLTDEDAIVYMSPSSHLTCTACTFVGNDPQLVEAGGTVAIPGNDFECDGSSCWVP